MNFFKERKIVCLVKTLSLLFTFLITLTFLNSCGGGGGGGTPVSQGIQLSGAVVTIDDQNTLDSLEPASVNTQTLVFSEETDETQNIAVGDILVFGVSNKTPLGLARKVISVQRNAGVTDVITEQASLTEVIDEGTINIRDFLSPNKNPVINTGAVLNGQSLYSNNSIKVVRSLPGVKIYTGDEYQQQIGDGFYAGAVISDFDNCVGDYDYVATLQPDTEIAPNIYANGCIAFSITNSELDIDISLIGGLDYFIFNYNPRVTSQLTINYDSSLDDKTEINLATFQLPSIPIPGTPVLVTPEIDIIVGVEAAYAASFIAGAITDASATIGVEYINDSWGPISEISPTFDPLQPTVNTTANVSVYAGPELQLLVWDMVGVQGNLHGYISLNADLNNDPLWLLYGGLRGGLGVTAEVFNKEIASWSIPDLISYEIEIANSNDFLDSLDDIINDSIIESNLETYPGNSPPNLEGKYYVVGEIIDSDNGLLIGQTFQSDVCLYGQTQDQEINFAEKNADIFAIATGNFITGTGDTFTIWEEGDATIDALGCAQHNSLIISGIKNYVDLSMTTEGLTTILAANNCGDVYPGFWYKTELLFSYVGNCTGPNDL